MEDFFLRAQKDAAEGIQKLNVSADDARASLAALEQRKESNPENEGDDGYIEYLRNYLLVVAEMNDQFQIASKEGAAILRESR